MKVNQEIVQLARATASTLITEKLGEGFRYHDLAHTISVVEATVELSKVLQLGKSQRRLLIIAAWFHDTGYTVKVEDHEIHGARLASEFLKKNEVDEEDIQTVVECILATKYPQAPANILQQVICDADMMHLSTKEFTRTADKLREEWQVVKGIRFSELEWTKLNFDFLSNHQYHTGYGREILQKRKEKHIGNFRKQLEELENNSDQSNGKTDAKKPKLQNIRLERGVETLFRTASGNHMRLSDMADNKAHILLSINSIIISVILSVLAKKITEASYLVWPTVLLLCVSVTTTVFAVLTTKPKISKGIFTKEQIDRKEVNLLFFGNFHQMDLELYEWGIQEVIYDKDYLYKSMTKDIYFLGKVLAAKYRYLNIGYRVFMYGLVTSVIAFAVSFLLYNYGF